jgi:hypothetical protein
MVKMRGPNPVEDAKARSIGLALLCTGAFLTAALVSEGDGHLPEWLDFPVAIGLTLGLGAIGVLLMLLYSSIGPTPQPAEPELAKVLAGPFLGYGIETAKAVFYGLLVIWFLTASFPVDSFPLRALGSAIAFVASVMTVQRIIRAKGQARDA